MTRIKYLNWVEIHRGFKYVEGWNEVDVFDHQPCINGIHYTDTDWADHKKWAHILIGVTHYRVVEAVEDEIVYPDACKYKARKVKLGPKVPLTGPPTEAMYVEYMCRDPDMIQYIQDPSEVIQLAAVEQRGVVIKYLSNPSEAVQMAAVKRSPIAAIQYIPNPSEAVQVEAVRKNGYVIEFITNPSEAVKLAAVQADGRALQYIPNPSEVLQLAAVRKRRGALGIEFISHPSEAVQLAAVQNNGTVIQHIADPSEAVQLAAVREYPRAIMWIKDPSETVKAAANVLCWPRTGEYVEYGIDIWDRFCTHLEAAPPLPSASKEEIDQHMAWIEENGDISSGDMPMEQFVHLHQLYSLDLTQDQVTRFLLLGDMFGESLYCNWGRISEALLVALLRQWKNPTPKQLEHFKSYPYSSYKVFYGDSEAIDALINKF